MSKFPLATAVIHHIEFCVALGELPEHVAQNCVFNTDEDENFYDISMEDDHRAFDLGIPSIWA